MENNKYNIRYCTSFNNEFVEILDYLTNELNNPNAAIRLVNELEEKIKILSMFPKLFTSKLYNGIQMYKFNIQNYSVFYSIENSNILICHIFYSKRNFSDIIK